MSQPTSGAGGGGKLWGGRFAASTHPILDAINKSIAFDIRLWRQDLRTNRAHARMLAAVGLLDDAERDALLGALDTVEAELEAGTFRVAEGDEDIHMAIERRATELVGDPGRKLHTARSRNDQVATDVRLFCVDAIADLRAKAVALIGALVDAAAASRGVVLPAYTHLQRGMPVLLSHHLLAYVEMLRRDHERLGDAARRTAVSPLGAGACVGTGLPIDRAMTAAELGFSHVSRNSLDAVSDRDFVLELLAALSITAVHLSRLGEELVLWSAKEFGFVRLHDSVATGSSMMPQKKNPDGAELIRGKSGRVFGSLVTLLTALKGLPLAYNKDMQEDKEPLFDAVDTVGLCLDMARVMVETLVVDAAALARAVHPEVFATDLAEDLVRLGVPLRTAHEAVGTLVRVAEREGTTLDRLDAAVAAAAVAELPLGAAAGRLGELLGGLDVAHAIESKGVPGGTASARVDEALDEARAWLAGL
jgi:argininosuccinate lyase